eukprot:UN26856
MSSISSSFFSKLGETDGDFLTFFLVCSCLWFLSDVFYRLNYRTFQHLHLQNRTFHLCQKPHFFVCVPF